MGAAAATYRGSKDELISPDRKQDDTKPSAFEGESVYLGNDSSLDLEAVNSTEAVDKKDKDTNRQLKRLALGQQGYKDQQRDYFDETLDKKGLNRTGQINWKSGE